MPCETSTGFSGNICFRSFKREGLGVFIPNQCVDFSDLLDKLHLNLFHLMVLFFSPLLVATVHFSNLRMLERYVLPHLIK